MRPYCRCGPRKILEPHTIGCPLAVGSCRGCGHALSKHRYYVRGGVNHRGAHIVCIVDNCAFTECLDPVAPGAESTILVTTLADAQAALDAVEVTP